MSKALLMIFGDFEALKAAGDYPEGTLFVLQECEEAPSTVQLRTRAQVASLAIERALEKQRSSG